MSVDKNKVAEKMMEFAQEQIKTMEAIIEYVNDTRNTPDVSDRLITSSIMLITGKMHYDNAGRGLLKSMVAVSEEKVAELLPEVKKTLRIENGDSQAPEVNDG